MSNVMSDRQERQEVLANVFSAINNMSSDRLSQILTFVRQIEEISGLEESQDRSLSKRELEVLTLVANGYSRKQVGECLGISANTAARHISTIYTKLGVTSIAEATRYAIRHGLA